LRALHRFLSEWNSQHRNLIGCQPFTGFERIAKWIVFPMVVFYLVGAFPFADDKALRSMAVDKTPHPR
jgi:hypothetical protein